MSCGCAYSRWLSDGHLPDCPERAAWDRLHPIGAPYPFPPTTTREETS